MGHGGKLGRRKRACLKQHFPSGPKNRTKKSRIELPVAKARRRSSFSCVPTSRKVGTQSAQLTWPYQYQPTSNLRPRILQLHFSSDRFVLLYFHSHPSPAHRFQRARAAVDTYFPISNHHPGFRIWLDELKGEGGGVQIGL